MERVHNFLRGVLIVFTKYPYKEILHGPLMKLNLNGRQFLPYILVTKCSIYTSDIRGSSLLTLREY